MKRIGGMDSVGVEIGHPGILNRVRGELSAALGWFSTTKQKYFEMRIPYSKIVAT